MNTGLTSLAKLPEVTAAYPFHGMELLFSGIIAAFFIAFIVYQIGHESKHHKTIIGNFTASPGE